jgi:Ala-tRNA(Pro) deacylase
MTVADSRGMFRVGDISHAAPKSFGNALQEKVYGALSGLDIPFSRVDTDAAVTIGDCTEIDRALGAEMVKTLFLCDRGHSKFYLLVLPGSKRFSSKAFSHGVGAPSSSISFAPLELMAPMLGTEIGAVTVFSVLLDATGRIEVVIDREVAESEWYTCSDGMKTSFMKLRTGDLLERFLPSVDHRPAIVEG